MIKRTHGVEGMSSMARASFHGLLSDWEFGVGMANTDANISTRCLGDDVHRAGHFWSDGHHANLAAGGLPQAIEDLNRGRDEILGRVHAAALVAEKRSFEVNS